MHPPALGTAVGVLGRASRRALLPASLQGLPPGSYLASLKELSLIGVSNSWQRTACGVLPDTLAAATSLERLDLSQHGWLRLRGAEDAALLRALPCLRRVKLPMWEREGPEAAAAVKEIRQALQGGGGAGVGTGPCHEVEVDISRYRSYSN